MTRTPHAELIASYRLCQQSVPAWRPQEAHDRAAAEIAALDAGLCVDCLERMADRTDYTFSPLCCIDCNRRFMAELRARPMANA